MRWPALLAVLAPALLLPLSALPGAEVPAETLQRRILDLRNDRIKGNCFAAVSYLGEHAGEKKVQEALLAAYYNTPDAQCREEAMLLLCRAPGFVPDERFMGEILRRMRHYGKPECLRGDAFEPAGNAGALLIAQHAAAFTDLIAGEIKDDFSGKDNSLWMQYAVVRALYKGGVLDKYANRFTPKYFTRLVTNLRDDRIVGNAKLASYILLFLGKDVGEPLQKALRGADSQARQLGVSILAFTSGKITRKQLAEKVDSILVNMMEDEEKDNMGDLDPHVNKEVET